MTNRQGAQQLPKTKHGPSAITQAQDQPACFRRSAMRPPAGPKRSPPIQPPSGPGGDLVPAKHARPEGIAVRHHRPPTQVNRVLQSGKQIVGRTRPSPEKPMTKPPGFARCGTGNAEAFLSGDLTRQAPPASSAAAAEISVPAPRPKDQEKNPDVPGLQHVHAPCRNHASASNGCHRCRCCERAPALVLARSADGNSPGRKVQRRAKNRSPKHAGETIWTGSLSPGPIEGSCVGVKNTKRETTDQGCPSPSSMPFPTPFGHRLPPPELAKAESSGLSDNQERPPCEADAEISLVELQQGVSSVFADYRHCDDQSLTPMPTARAGNCAAPASHSLLWTRCHRALRALGQGAEAIAAALRQSAHGPRSEPPRSLPPNTSLKVRLAVPPFALRKG